MIIKQREKIIVNDLLIFIPAIVYILSGLISTLITRQSGFYFVKEISFLLVPSFIAIGIYNTFKNRKLEISKAIFWAIAICNIRFIPKFSYNDLLESQYAFIFGVYVLYFFIKCEWKYVIFSSLLLFLAHKRIAISSVLIALCIILIIKLINDYKHKKRVLVFVSITTVFLSYLFVWLIIGGVVQDYLRVHNISLMGREHIWGIMSNQVTYKPGFVGKGIGFVQAILAQIHFNDAALNLHSDLYSAFIEIGFIGFGLWVSSYFIFLYYMGKRNELSIHTIAYTFVFIVYTIALYSTDNVLIYIEYWLPLNLILLEIVNKKRIKMKNKKRK